MFDPVKELKKLVESAYKHNWVMNTDNYDTFMFWIKEIERKSNKNE